MYNLWHFYSRNKATIDGWQSLIIINFALILINRYGAMANVSLTKHETTGFFKSTVQLHIWILMNYIQKQKLFAICIVEHVL